MHNVLAHTVIEKTNIYKLSSLVIATTALDLSREVILTRKI